MADPSDVATDAQQPETILQVVDLVETSYKADVNFQQGVSDQTLLFLREYVDALALLGLADVLTEENAPYLRDVILGSLDIGATYRAEIASAIDARLADLAKGRASASTDSPQRNVMQAADPVDLFSGQFTQDAADLVIDGAGIGFVFRRSYRNQAVYFGPLGAKWDHCYNLWLRQLGGNLIRSSGETREDVYKRHPRFGQAGFDYWLPPDGRQGVIEESGTSFVWRSPGGIRHVYAPETADHTFHRIQRIQDRFGNYLAFSYVDDRLTRVEVNNPKRFVEFDYGPEDRIATLQDHTGRVWRYAYDDFGDLVAVTTPSTDRYPSGLTTGYEYSSATESSRPLQHNLLRIVDPAGQLYLENEYGTNAGLLDFNRVVRQRQGNGEALFEYETVVSEFEFDYGPEERPAVQVNQTLRNGHLVHHVFNSFGNLLLREEYVGPLADRRMLRMRHRYNRDGSLVGTLSAEGHATQWYYGRDDWFRANGLTDDGDIAGYQDVTASERLAFGNLLATVRRARRYDLDELNLARGVWGDFFPDVIGATDKQDIVVKQTYEPDFQLVHTVSDPRFTTRADPRYAEPATYDSHLTRYEYAAAAGHVLRRIRYPDTTFPSPLPDGTAGVIDAHDDFLRYDARGRLERWRNPEQEVSERRYFGGGAAAVTQGYLRQWVRDPDGLALTTTYDVNDVGINKSVTNARGAETSLVINELNQVVETISAGPAFHTRSFYDENGLIARSVRDNRDDAGAPSPEGDEVSIYRYDSQNNLLLESRGGADVTKHHVTRHRYDAADQRIETIRPRGNSIRFGFDERFLPTSTTRGAGTALASMTRQSYDGDALNVAATDGRGNLARVAYDALGRAVRTTDPLGHVRQSEYDKLDNVTVARFFERQADGSFALLQRQEFDYDERGDRVRETGWLFESPIATADIDHDPDAEFDTARAQGDAVAATTELFYDGNRRLFRSVNPVGQETTYEYDSVGRKVIERDNGGNYISTTYDENSNVVRVDRHELVRDSQGALLREDVFSLLHEYDVLDRRTATIDALGNRTRLTYDSRSNAASVTDPLDNVVRSTYDVFNRRIEEVRETTNTGLGGGTRRPDVVTQYEFDENDLLVATIDPTGNRTAYEHDEFDRLALVTYVDGSSEQLRHDPDDNLAERTDNNGLRVLYTTDPLNRQTAVDLDTSGVDPRYPYPAAAETFERRVYDGLGRPVHHESDACTVDVRFDSLSRAFEEKVRFTTSFPGPTGTLTLSRGFDLISNRTELGYPSGRKLRYEYDDLNLLTSIANLLLGAGYPGSGAPSQYPVAEFEHRGLRAARTSFGNGALCDWAYDGAARVTSVRHQTADVDVELQQLYDGAGNRRYEAEYPAGATAKGKRYSFDSLCRLTRDRQTAVAQIDPVAFEPPSAPLLPAAMTGQQAIDAAIGSLADDQTNFTYRYDRSGNRLEERPPGHAPIMLTPNALNQIATVDGTSLRYDLNGNLVDDGDRLYRYNYRNQLAQVLQKSNNSVLVRLIYDAAGRLAAIREGGQAVHLISDGPHVVEEWTAAGVIRQYVYGDGIDRRCQLAAVGVEWWFHSDVLGSTRWLSDSSGHVAANAEFAYDAFGAPEAPVTHENPYLFAGRRFLRSVGLYDQRARQYAPRLGRFLQRDPKGFVDGPNLYVYAGNNPASFTDPMGRQKATVQGEEPKPSVEEYFRGKYKPSVEEQAQIGGLMRFLVYLNPATMGSPENMAKAEAAIDRLIPFAYAPDDLERAKQLEVVWSTIFEQGLFAGLGAAADAEAVTRLAVRYVPRAAASLGQSAVEEGVAAERAAVAAGRVEAAAAPSIATTPVNIVEPGVLPPTTNGITRSGLKLENPGGLLGRLGLRRPVFNPTIEVVKNPVGSTLGGVVRHERTHLWDMLNYPQFSDLALRSRVPGRGIANFIFETRGYYAEFGIRGLNPSYAWRSMTNPFTGSSIGQAHLLGDLALIGGVAGTAGGLHLLQDKLDKEMHAP